VVYGAIDLHTRKSYIRIIDAEGQVQRERQVATTRDTLVHAFEGAGPLRILVEASTESEWVAQALEAAGHEVVVADPNYAPMYGALQRRVKTDRRDVAALAEANRRGWYRATHRASAAQRAVRQVLRTRRQLVKARSEICSLRRALLRQDGYRVPAGAAETLSERIDALRLPDRLVEVLAPLQQVADTLTQEIAGVDARLEALAAADPVVTALRTVPGVGCVVGLTFRATLDDVGRFGSAAAVSAAVGLVPREKSSAERQHRGAITKTGPRELRRLLVQAAWACWRSRRCLTLRAWADGVAARRGKRVAVVGLARRLSRILYAMWRDGTTFDAAILARAA